MAFATAIIMLSCTHVVYHFFLTSCVFFFMADILVVLFYDEVQNKERM